MLIGLAGQPYVAELFDASMTLRRQFDAIVAAAWEDSLGLEPVATPGRRARRFVGRLEETKLARRGDAGLGVELGGRTEHVDIAALGWERRVVHQRASHVRHPLFAGAHQ